MATPSDLPNHLRDHARRTPEGLLQRLYPAEALHRLTHVHDTLRAAGSLQAGQYRHVTAQAQRELRAMPYDEFCAERDRLNELKAESRFGDSEVAARHTCSRREKSRTSVIPHRLG